MKVINGSDKENKKTWKHFKEKLELKRAAGTSWISNIPIFASDVPMNSWTFDQAEADAYNTLDPAVVVVILKPLCDIRVAQSHLNYISLHITILSASEISVGKKLKNDMLPEVEKVHKKKEKLLKKQHMQALMLDNMINMDGHLAGCSLRDRKPVTYTFYDYDRSINEAIKVTKKKQPYPEPNLIRESSLKLEDFANGRWTGPSEFTHVSFKLHSPKSPENDGIDNYHEAEPLDRGNRQRHKPQRYSTQEFVEAISDNDADFNSDDDIVGEVVYDEEYLRRQKKRRKIVSEDSDEPQKFKKLPGRTRRESKLRSRWCTPVRFKT
nr:DDT domain-containing protein DDR4 [Ipomoea batatas]GME09349.1 DDT domain-containing protein DDR4 [Ipomoea batatas]